MKWCLPAILTVLVVSCVVPAIAETTERTEPTPEPSPSAFSWSGRIRAYDFTKDNCSGDASSPCRPSKSNSVNANENQSAFNAALLLHGQYRLVRQGWYLGATLVEANPLGFNGPCGSTANYAAGGSCSQYPPNEAYYNTDTSLPAFALSTLAEAYVAYKGNGLAIKIGNQEYTSSWAGPSDSRIKAAYYEGASARYQISPMWRVDADRMTQWQSRTSSDFNKSNLIVPLASDGSIANPTSGFLRLATSYTPDRHVVATAELYQFYDIGSLVWLQASWSGIGMQYGHERNTGAALVGTIESDVFGAQIQKSAGKNTVLAFAYDTIPQRTATIALPKGVTCKNNVISSASKTGYWLPSGGTANCVPSGASSAVIYYGGIASPYSDSYQDSPLFATNMSQDMVGRRSPGSSYKLSVTFYAINRQLTFAVAQVWNDYSNGAGAEETTGTNIDVTYKLRRMAGPYRGISIRDRWLALTQSTALYGGKPLTVANRLQFEYDF